MSMFDGVLGGLVGGEMASVVNGLIEQHGGLQGIISHLQSQGLGDTVRSWVGTGPNQPISAAQITQAFGSDKIRNLAAEAGIDPQVLAEKLSQLLPKSIDGLTPGGSVPKA